MNETEYVFAPYVSSDGTEAKVQSTNSEKQKQIKVLLQR